ncbi:MAG: hypothetical protein AB1422_00640 [bacterium]
MQVIQHFVYWIGIFLTLYSMVWGQDTAIPTSEPISISIVSVANIKVEDKSDIILDTLDEAGGVDVKIDVWDCEEGSRIWVLVNAQGTHLWRCYSHAREDDKGIWTLPGVRLGEGAYQGRNVTLRAIVLKEGESLSSNEVYADEWKKKANAISAPVNVTIPAREVLSEDIHGIWISTINGQCVTPEDPAVIPPAAGVAGTVRLPHSPQSGETFIYIIVHAPGTDKWRIFGPAEVNGVKWEMKGILIADQANPTWTDFDIFAIVSKELLDTGTVNRPTWRESFIVSSPKIHVFVKKLPLLDDPERIPKVTIERIKRIERREQTFYGRSPADIVDAYVVNVDRFLELPFLEDIIEIEGTVKYLPQGASLWTILSPLDTREWIVQDGPAFVCNGTWTLKGLNSISMGNNKTNCFELICVVSNATLPLGVVGYDLLRQSALAVSPSLIIKITGKRKNPISQITLSISRIAGIKVHPGRKIQVPNNGYIEGKVENLPNGTQIWVGIHKRGRGIWSFYGPALVRENTWEVPNAIFQGENKKEEDTLKEYEIIAIVTKGMLPGKYGPYSWWRNYTLEASPTIYGVNVSEKTKTGINKLQVSVSKKGESNSWKSWLFWIIIALLSLLVLAILEYFFQIPSILSGYLAETFESIYGKREVINNE